MERLIGVNADMEAMAIDSATGGWGAAKPREATRPNDPSKANQAVEQLRNDGQFSVSIRASGSEKATKVISPPLKGCCLHDYGPSLRYFADSINKLFDSRDTELVHQEHRMETGQ